MIKEVIDLFVPSTVVHHDHQPKCGDLILKLDIILALVQSNRFQYASINSQASQLPGCLLNLEYLKEAF